MSLGDLLSVVERVQIRRRLRQRGMKETEYLTPPPSALCSPTRVNTGSSHVFEKTSRSPTLLHTMNYQSYLKDINAPKGAL